MIEINNSSRDLRSFFEWRFIVKLIASIDIFYALLLIAIHLLALITAGRGNLAIQNSKISNNFSFTNETFITKNNTESKNVDVSLDITLWIGLFSLYILQLLVAGALYGGLKQRDERVTVRNCRIWTYISSILLLIIFFQISLILLNNLLQNHIFKLIILSVEILLRIFGIFGVGELIKEINIELSEENGDATGIYYELQNPTPTPLSKYN